MANVDRDIKALRQRIAELEARAFNPAILDVIAERQRQKTVEGWTPEHDDQYEDGELIDAAACYAQDSSLWDCVGEPPSDWPWSDEWWKPSKNMRRNLVKAGALILAEIERRDRAAGIGTTTPDLLRSEHANVHYADAAEIEISALRQRIAELEARSDIDMSDADCFTIERLHEIIYGEKLKWPEAKILARFMHDVKQRCAAGIGKGA